MNSGDLPCKVIIEIANDENKTFAIKINDLKKFLTYYKEDGKFYIDY